MSIKLTEYSHGAGCGCKISPRLLDEILKSERAAVSFPQLLVGNDSKDDAAVYDLGNGTSVISTTDFFMPIVDDPFEFGQIAATNALSDVYAMGGKPLMAIAVFGWPIAKLGADVARAVIDGGRRACELANIPLAGGHSIDAPEPIFGLAVTGLVENQYLKQNSRATTDSRLYLTKPLGIGILTTAQKKNQLKPEHARLAPDTMCILNQAGGEFSRLSGITAMTDVTGFGLLGHLLEICQGSGVAATIDFNAVPKLEGIDAYLDLGCSPGGAQRNFDSYGEHVSSLSERQRQILCDPQTSGGLLVAVNSESEQAFLELASALGMNLQCIGHLHETRQSGPVITVV